jgi:hypothetical protein
MQLQHFEFPHPVTTEWVKFEIVNVYRGTKYDTTPVSEIQFDYAPVNLAAQQNQPTPTASTGMAATQSQTPATIAAPADQRAKELEQKEAELNRRAAELDQRQAEIEKNAHVQATPVSTIVPTESSSATATTQASQPVQTSSPDQHVAPTGVSHATTFDQIIAAHGAYENVGNAPRLEKGKFYQLGAFAQQTTAKFILLKTSGFPAGRNHSAIPEKLFGVLVPHNKQAFEGIQVTQGAFISAVGSFIGFNDMTLTTGAAERLPVFDCVAIKVNGIFFNLE